MAEEDAFAEAWAVVQRRLGTIDSDISGIETRRRELRDEIARLDEREEKLTSERTKLARSDAAFRLIEDGQPLLGQDTMAKVSLPAIGSEEAPRRKGPRGPRAESTWNKLLHIIYIAGEDGLTENTLIELLPDAKATTIKQYVGRALRDDLITCKGDMIYNRSITMEADEDTAAGERDETEGESFREAAE